MRVTILMLMLVLMLILDQLLGSTFSRISDISVISIIPIIPVFISMSFSDVFGQFRYGSIDFFRTWRLAELFNHVYAKRYQVRNHFLSLLLMKLIDELLRLFGRFKLDHYLFINFIFHSKSSHSPSST